MHTLPWRASAAAVIASIAVLGALWAPPAMAASGGSRGIVDATLSSGATISGTVTSDSGARIDSGSFGWMYAIPVGAGGDPYAPGVDSWWSVITDGRYTITDLPAGDYTVQFRYGCDCGGPDQLPGAPWVEEYFQNSPSLAGATSVRVGADEAVSGIDFTLTPRVQGERPRITGIPAVGGTLTANAHWFADGTTSTYRWYADEVVIAGATAATFTLTAAQANKAISVSVIGSIPGYASNGGTSRPTEKVLLPGSPTISGTAATGSTLTANPGTWSTGTVFSYQWYADGVAIGGATASTFSPTAAHAGTQISVQVTGTLGGYPTVSAMSAKTVKLARAAAPTISGTAAVGYTLTATPGSWTTGTTFTYQWYADSAPISGARASTFVPPSTLSGKQVWVKVAGSATGYPTVTMSSARTAKLAVIATPTISGTAAVGSTLTATPGTWTAGTAFAYQWYAGSTAIAGATAKAYTLTTSQAGAQISVKVTGKLTGYTTVSRTSAKTVKVLLAATPTISGTAAVGSTLTAKTGTWATGTAFAYQWYAGSTAIAGATAKTYTLTTSQAGAQISVKVTGKLTGYTTVSRTSAKTAKVLLATTPTISGTAAVGSTLTVRTGTWTTGTAFTYQWYRDGIAISGATASTYLVRPTDAYAAVSVRVVGGKSGYASATKSSASTAPAAGKVYANCTALNADYPDGIRKNGITTDRKSGVAKPLVGTPYESTPMYNLQSIARDADRDGIMCER
ncbi:excalibur calcium-binding domain-containing protein [Microbacterium sp. C5A9]|uniref:excalibur calcium-binding domain-containing protein n=1 Tax=Microbacterium sp. C5A9 TaxID=2736663 RepID=UPI001F51983A|nr:excalibur calcium-binding domain-containing protein [Microbacterium sp. C5A9]MCI1019167.1 excalibur calcium-binding domain-containing protein [Microbacterium sp. C5A9]